MKKKPVEDVTNQLAVLREQRGLSVAALAGVVGVTRQTIYAIEKGSYVPNTAVGLRLARALAVSVEELFRLPEQAKGEPQTESATLLPSFEEVRPGQPVQLCEVDGQLMAAPSAPAAWYLPASDGVVRSRTPVRSKARVDLHEPGANFGERILLAGCDPAVALIARHLQEASIEVVLLHQNSWQSLSLLQRGQVHVAGTHLRDAETGESNQSAIDDLFPAGSVAAVSFAVWQEGLVVANGNPKDIRGVEDLARPEVRFVNREAGAGSRKLLDDLLQRAKVDAQRVRGYERTAPGHLAAAWEVKTGAADCCLATQAAARVLGLEFLALETARYDLVVRKQHLNLPGIEALFELINRLSFRQELASVGGYDTGITGKRII